MAQLIFLNVFLLGAAALLVLVIRALPRLGETEPVARRGVFERWLTSELPGRIDAFMSAARLRTLRRFKVFILRMDNGINQKLQRMKLESNEGIKIPKIDLKKVTEGRTAEEEAQSD